MTRSIISWFVAVCLLCGSSFAQEYKIQDFFADSLTTWQVYGSSDFRGNYKEDKVDDKEDGELDSYYLSTINLSPEISYKFKYIRPYYKNTLNLNSGLNIFRHKYRYSKTINLEKGFDLNYNFSRYNYLKNKLGYGFQSSGYLYLTNDNFDIKDDDSRWRENGERIIKTNQYNINISPGVSYGRIYNGQYAAKAMEIIDELRKMGLLKSELSLKEFRELSQIIMKRKATYHYDNRIKKIEALNAIMEYLIDIEAVEPDSYSAAFILQDIYSYGLIGKESDRKFGFKSYARVIGEYFKLKRIKNGVIDVTIYDHSEPGNIDEQYFRDDYDKDKSEYFSQGLQLGFDYYKIKNWHFYFNFGLDLKIYQRHDEYIEIINDQREYSIPDTSHKELEYSSKDKINRHMRAITFTNAFYYKFNSRSIFVWNNRIFYQYSHRKDSKKDKAEEYRIIINPQYVYYFTPKFRISAGISYNLYKSWNYYSGYYNEVHYNYKDIKNSEIKVNLLLGYYF
jgi:hypothetical protein